MPRRWPRPTQGTYPTPEGKRLPAPVGMLRLDQDLEELDHDGAREPPSSTDEDREPRRLLITERGRR
jgi:hypothetical protein